MKNRKIIYIVVTLLTGIVITASLCYYYLIKVPTQTIAERCTEYDPEWEDLEDCYGLVSIRTGWDINYYYLFDHVHQYEIARIYNLKQFIATDQNIYVINRGTTEENMSSDVNKKYYQKLFQGGKLITNYYGSTADIPTYLVIDYKTGETKVYKNIDQVPESEKEYFREIESK